jgi:hypothetical protein
MTGLAQRLAQTKEIPGQVVRTNIPQAQHNAPPQPRWQKRPTEDNLIVSRFK